MYHIWKVTKEQRQAHSPVRDLNFVVRVLLDSGMLYLFITIPHFAVWWIPSSSGAIPVLANFVYLSSYHVMASADTLYRTESAGHGKRVQPH